MNAARTDANNMYVGGRAEARPWDDASGHFENLNTPPVAGRVIEPSVRRRDYVPDLRHKDLRPVEFPGIGPGSSEAELREAVAWVEQHVGWYHSVDLPQGVSTPGGRGWEWRAQAFDSASLVRGKTVLDVGAMEGGDTFCAEGAGAASVTAYDVDNYFGYCLGRNAAWDFVVDKHIEARDAGPEAEWVFLNSKRFGFELCRTARGSAARRISGSVYDLDPGANGVFDVVLCYGLLYHLRHPMLAIDKLASVTGEVLLVNNQVFTGPAPERETVLFYPDTWRGAHTNWYVPGYEAFLGMLTSSGFRKVEVVAVTETTVCAACWK